MPRCLPGLMRGIETPRSHGTDSNAAHACIAAPLVYLGIEESFFIRTHCYRVLWTNRGARSTSATFGGALKEVGCAVAATRDHESYRRTERRNLRAALRMRP